MTGQITHIYRYPVKGFTADPLETVTLSPDQRLPFDRWFALAPATTVIQGATTAWMPKPKFVVLMKHEKVATLRTEFDEETKTLTVLRGGRQVAKGDLTQTLGRSMLEDFFAAYLKDESQGRPKLVEAADGGLTDDKDPLISLIGLPSINDFSERVVKQPVHHMRFRANLYVDGIEPWAELNWVGKTVKIGDVVFEGVKRTDRCPAINVNPETAERDQNLVKDLMGGYGHVDMGVFLRVVEGGSLRLTDPVIVE